MTMSLVHWPHRREPPELILGPRDRLKLPEDLERDLHAALNDEPFGAPQRTAQAIAAEIARLRTELTNARELVAQGEAKEATLVAELTKAVDDQIAAKKAMHDTEVAELEALRPSTGETA
jgi:hypothetical protein